MSTIHNTSLERAVESGVYDKNRRYPVEAGTKFTQASVRFHYTEDDEVRQRASAEALEAAVVEFRRVYGDLDWQSASISTVHVSCQVLVELRVAPEWRP